MSLGLQSLHTQTSYLLIHVGFNSKAISVNEMTIWNKEHGSHRFTICEVTLLSSLFRSCPMLGDYDHAF